MRDQFLNNNKKTGGNKGVIIFIIILIVAFLWIVSSKDNELTNSIPNRKDGSFNIIVSNENKDLEQTLTKYAKSKNYKINIEYAGTLDIMDKINDNPTYYDAAWFSNSIWTYMLDSSKASLVDSQYTNINPVIFGIKKSKAEKLGFVGKEIKLQQILDKVASGELKFCMANPKITNSGASAYLGFLQTLAGNPEVLKSEDLQNEQLKTKLKELFTGLERSSGSEDFLEELALDSGYDAVVTYESSIININKELVKKGQEPFYAIYPIDGVSISDSPFGYISNSENKNNINRKEIFTDIQSYILSEKGQKELQEQGRRTWYGGISTNVDKSTFNPDWGIDTTKYISPIKYPNTSVIKEALNLYQTELRKPTHIVFCLDYSGSMYGTGYKELIKAMEYILGDNQNDSDFLAFSEKDKIDVIPFESKADTIWSTDNGTKTSELFNKIKSKEPSGGTALHVAAANAILELSKEDLNKYNASVVLMTDGQGNIGKLRDLTKVYNQVNKDIPIYSITFGSAEESQLEEIAELTKGKVFNGKTNLRQAFKQVRGYN